MELRQPKDIFALSSGDIVTKRNLFDLIQYSKIVTSSYWGGSETIIGNTPQQGINWVGKPPQLQAVIIKTRSGSYAEDGWSDKSKTAYRYSFKARHGEISYSEKANKVLVQQPQHLYPIFLFSEHKGAWRCEGSFSVSEIQTRFVVLHRGIADPTTLTTPQDEIQYLEGERKYVTHLMAERSKSMVDALKRTKKWICDICKKDYFSEYGVKYIEAHHKIPISTYSSSYVVGPADFALLCPNCHKAVHIYMKKEELEYAEIRNKLVAIADQTTR